MNRSDKIFIGFVLILSLLIYGLSDFIFNAITSDELQAVVYVRDKEFGRYNMKVDQEVTIAGDLGDVVVEIKDEKVRIQTETSPLHICSLQGWIDKAYVQLICLPNSVIVQIENSNHHIPEPEIDGVSQ